MASDPITIQVEDAELRRDISGLIKRLKDPKPALNEVGLYMVRSTLKTFRMQGHPEKWKPVQQRRLDRRAAASRQKSGKSVRGHKILQDTGNLRGSIAPASGHPDIWEVTDKYVMIGTNVKYAATHQYGDPSRNIAARPFLLFQKNASRAIIKILRSHVEGGA